MLFQFELKGGEVVTLTDNSDAKRWRVRVGADASPSKELKEVTVPAIIVLIPPTDSAALDAALK